MNLTVANKNGMACLDDVNEKFLSISLDHEDFFVIYFLLICKRCTRRRKRIVLSLENFLCFFKNVLCNILVDLLDFIGERVKVTRLIQIRREVFQLRTSF